MKRINPADDSVMAIMAIIDDKIARLQERALAPECEDRKRSDFVQRRAELVSLKQAIFEPEKKPSDPPSDGGSIY